MCTEVGAATMCDCVFVFLPRAVCVCGSCWSSLGVLVVRFQVYMLAMVSKGVN